MVKYEIARQMGGKEVITTQGEPVGKIFDIEVGKDGKLISLLVIPVPNAKVTFPKDANGRFVIPYDKVNAVGTYVTVNV